MIPLIWHYGKHKTVGIKDRKVVAKEWGWGGCLTTKGEHEEIWGLLETFYILILVVNTQIHAILKTEE